jgi:hypothetical protein
MVSTYRSVTVALHERCSETDIEMFVRRGFVGQASTCALLNRPDGSNALTSSEVNQMKWET